MNLLIITVGPPCSGKSTDIELNKLVDYTVSTDKLRVLLGSKFPILKNTYRIQNYKDDLIWDAENGLLSTVLKNRFELGQTTILDSTGLSNLNYYKQLAKKYNYRIVYAVYDDISIEELKQRNLNRIDSNYLPDFVIDKFVDRLKSFHTTEEVLRRSEFKTTTLLRALDWGNFYQQDFSHFKQIRVFPDIHSNFDVIQNYFIKEPEDKNTAYIFVGDYIDRGNKPIEVINFLLEKIDQDNFFFLLGNHDMRLLQYAHNLSQYENDPYLNLGGGFLETIKKIRETYDDTELRKFFKKIRKISKKLKFYLYFNYNNQKYFINHAGVDFMGYQMPASLLTGVVTQGYDYCDGDYESYIEVGNKWKENHPDIIQIFGHRNIKPFLLEDEVKINENAYCIECNVEWGNDLGVLTIDSKNNISKINIKNTLIENDVSKFINIKTFPENGVYSINFNKNVFFKAIWNNFTVKARGLFKYIENDEIACRSYDKFFNLNETKESTLKEFLKNIVYPVNFYVKYDGFLLMVYWNKFLNHLDFATKRMVNTDHTEMAKKLFTDGQLEHLKKYCKENDVTYVFECIHDNDMVHPILYEKNEIILLDIVRNTKNFDSVVFVEENGSITNLPFRLKTSDLQLLGDLRKAPFEYLDEEYINDFINDWSQSIEGWVIEDGNYKKLKIKTPFFRVLKTVGRKMSERDNINDNLGYGPSDLINKISEIIYKEVKKCNITDFKEIRKIYDINKINKIKNNILYKKGGLNERL